MYEKAVHQLLAPYISLYPDMGNGKFNNSLTSFNANGKNIHGSVAIDLDKIELYKI